MPRLVPVRICDVGEVDMERRVRLDDRVGSFERVREHLRRRERAVARRVHMGEIEHRPHPA